MKEEQEKTEQTQSSMDFFAMYNLEQNPKPSQPVESISNFLKPKQKVNTNTQEKREEQKEPTEEERKKQKELDQVLGIGPNYVPPTPEIKEEELLSKFIGKNYEKITNKKFSFAAFFFGGFYLLYRKMYFLGFLLLLFFLILMPLYPILTGILFFFLHLCFGFFVKKMYLTFAKKKIYNLKKDSKEQMEKECIKQGGTNRGAVFLGLIFQLLIGFILCYFLTMLGIRSISIPFLDRLPFFPDFFPKK